MLCSRYCCIWCFVILVLILRRGTVIKDQGKYGDVNAIDIITCKFQHTKDVRKLLLAISQNRFACEGHPAYFLKSFFQPIAAFGRAKRIAFDHVALGHSILNLRNGVLLLAARNTGYKKWSQPLILALCSRPKCPFYFRPARWAALRMCRVLGCTLQRAALALGPTDKDDVSRESFFNISTNLYIDLKRSLHRQ